MYIKFIRKLNFYWGLIGVILLAAICSLLLTLVKSEKYQVVIMDLIVELVGSSALFFGFYLLRFCFQKSKYPFITCEPWEVETPFLNKIAKYQWVWIILIPILLGTFIPLIWFFATFFTIDANMEIKAIRIGCLLGSLILTSSHNLIYIWVLNKKSKTMTQEFDFQNLQ